MEIVPFSAGRPISFVKYSLRESGSPVSGYTSIIFLISKRLNTFKPKANFVSLNDRNKREWGREREKEEERDNIKYSIII